MPSDEESADEDVGGLIDNLSGQQLRSHAEVVFRDGERQSDDDVDAMSTTAGRLYMLPQV